MIVSQLGNDPQVLAAAIGLVAAEQNFNNFVADIPKICDDPTLPATEALRGIVPLVDPGVGDSDVENANSAKSKTAPFPNAGLSVAQVMAAQGFTNFTTPAGGAPPPPPVADDNEASPVVDDAPAPTEPATAPVDDVEEPCVSTVTVTTFIPKDTASTCRPSTVTVTAEATAAPTAEAPVADAPADEATGGDGAAGGVDNGAAGVAPALIKSTIAGLDFGLCMPTIKFEAGLNGRSEAESTFQAQDPLVNKGQQEALNPNIITNRICDQLTNVCQANAAAKTACLDAKAQILALGTRDATTADAWNTALGFDGADINPDNAPQPGLIGHA